MRNVDSFFNKERLIKYTVKVNIYYQEYRERTEIDIIRRQKQSVILEILQIASYNLEINQRIREVKMTNVQRSMESSRNQSRKNQNSKNREKRRKEKEKEEKEQKKKEKTKKKKNNRG